VSSRHHTHENSPRHRRIKRSACLRTGLIFVASQLLFGCQTWQHRVGSIAESAGLHHESLSGAGFEHEAYLSVVGGRYATLLVMLDGDGSPWVDGGTRASDDPTPRRPVALQIAGHTPGAVLYLGRPCYLGRSHDTGCVPELWTSARYSETVVRSMATALNRFVESHGVREVVLVGYSGGGTLAVLMAPRVPSVRAVVTIAANLDVDAWTDKHGYLPLADSLNPVNEPQLPSAIPEWHVVGGRDRNVPWALNRKYWTRVPEDHVWRYEQADHACCWVELWPQILERLGPALRAEASRDVHDTSSGP
jgi:dienelactone hydrolase